MATIMVAQKSRARVLIVDDDDITLQAMACLLTAAGYETQTAGTFHDGLRTLRENPPDLLLADIRLGDFNGLQLVASNPTPAIMVTGYPDPVLEADARRMGADFLIKPVVPPDLLELVARKLASTRTFEPVRRWRRKQINGELSARIEDSPARIVDVSYGGLRFEIERDADHTLPASFDVSLPELSLSIPADLVWMTRSPEGRFLCGATVLAEEQPIVEAWRQLVDAVA